MIQELECGKGRATTSRPAGDPQAQELPDRSSARTVGKPHNNRSPVAAHLMSGRYPERQQRLEHRLVMFLDIAILFFSRS